MANILKLSVVFKKDTTLKNAWSIFDDSCGTYTFLAGKKVKCIIGDDGIRFCRIDKNGKEVYSYPFEISKIADHIMLTDFSHANLERKIIKPTNGYNYNVPYECYTCSNCSCRIKFNSLVDNINYCYKCGSVIDGIIDKK